ncbi:hypothetical protein [Streptomyces noursei]|uniref:hypothetical protein n=1 Tax=Streptomyces noursei TaxID=1971 RepID=UPI00130E21AC|nr:hypothetical protein [Streptomyces noursei]
MSQITRGMGGWNLTLARKRHHHPFGHDSGITTVNFFAGLTGKKIDGPYFSEARRR